MQTLDLTKEIYPNQLAKELEDAGLERGFNTRTSDNTITFVSDDSKVKDILDNHAPDKEIEDSFKLVIPTSEELKQEKIDEIDSIKDLAELKEYIKKDKGLI